VRAEPKKLQKSLISETSVGYTIITWEDGISQHCGVLGEKSGDRPGGTEESRNLDLPINGSLKHSS